MNPEITEWEDKRVWLVGASSGIGAALARALLVRGARVALSGRDGLRLLNVVKGVAGSGDALILPCDVTEEASVQRAWKRLLGVWGGVDVAIYLAGDYLPMHAWALDVKKAQHMIDVNLTGAVRFAACVVPQLLKQGSGHIGFTASVAGYRGLPRSLIYGPTKAALINFAEALYLDLSPKGIGVRVINPGFVATPLTAQNEFAMPALITPEVAAEATIDGLAGHAFEIDYPKRFTRFMKLLATLPHCLYFPLVRRLTSH
jgi:NAD(P)-dependent dehydrogenase (short-subunit alcohol dehydrogenase family)